MIDLLGMADVPRHGVLSLLCFACIDRRCSYLPVRASLFAPLRPGLRDPCHKLPGRTLACDKGGGVQQGPARYPGGFREEREAR